MLLPSVAVVLVYCYGPMLGSVIAFQDFVPAKGLFGHQTWVGFDNFVYIFNLPNAVRVLTNTVIISLFKMVLGLVVPVFFALLLNEVGHKTFKKAVQTFVYLPHFLSWVILAGVIIDILSPNGGIVNNILARFGIEPIYFLGDNHWFPFTIITSDIWKEFGFSTIVYLAAMTGISPELYETAEMDGAGRLRKMWSVTLPGIRMIVVLMAVLSLGNILNAGFDQIINLYSPAVYESGDIIDTFVYRIGLLEARYSISTAIGLFKSIVSFFLISIAYFLSYKIADHRIF